MSTDTLVPILIYLTGETRTNEVVLVDENIPDYYLESGERSITKAFVAWQPSDIFPRETEIVEGKHSGCSEAARGAERVRYRSGVA
ncbi:hypothetical protein KXV51_005847 [Aspergillus fumigatus]|nr:hypothetical protein KXX01_005343 [Aspergillus fumigatus]KAH2273717.1 hypothetical protein KXW26_005546 [Aspergillus fumigatus]KAH2697001.1 hypothetical protein KXV51_005847 [Aspergillus fumigatus]KAH2870640.1 hypothetical protein KXV67_003314 [Aspergillus fumigatus]KAH2936257.1 hypothetical protein KXW15_003744 [Aspergillus fumigatus]